MSCPICQKETHKTYRPFCSRRCADIDLSKWMGGQYAFASTREEDAEEVSEAMADELSVAEPDDRTKLH